jgi:hypothetical protein
MRSGTEVINSPGRGRVREMGDSGSDPAPHGRPVVVAGGHELVRSGGTFLERLVAIALEHQLCGLPNVDLRDHALKLHPPTVNERLRPEIARRGRLKVVVGWRRY